MAPGLSTQVSFRLYLRSLLLLSTMCMVIYMPVVNGQVTIPSSNTNDTSDWKPLGCFNGYERTEMLYSANDINSPAGYITKVGFFVNGLSDPAENTPVVIRMKTTTNTSLTSAIYGTDSTGSTLVYSGNVTSSMLTENNWVTITLTTPFNYASNTLSLIVLVETNFGDYGGESFDAKEIRQSSTVANRCQFWEDNLTPPTDYGILTHKRPNIQLTFQNVCSGPPNPGNTISTINPVCSGESFTLSLENISITPGLTYDWQWSPNGTNSWTDLPGGTNSTYTTSQSIQTYYRCKVTCTTTSDVTNSNVLAVDMNPFYHCYCASYAFDLLDTKIDSVHLGTIVTGSEPFICESYTDYTGIAPASLIPGAPNTLHIVNGSCSSFDDGSFVSAYIDFNHNAIFDEDELVYTYGQVVDYHSIPDGMFSVPTTAQPGITGLRIILKEGDAPPVPCGEYTYGETEDYLVDIAVVTACSGIPDTGSTLSTDTHVCPNQPFTLSLSSYSPNTDLSYQWQESNNGVSGWQPITGATATTHVDSQTVAMYYRCNITCAISGSSQASTPVFIDMNPSYACYCESGAIYSSDTKIDSVMFGTIFTGSAETACETYTDHTDIVTDLVKGFPTLIHVRNGSCTGESFEAYLSVYIDYNHNQTYETAELAYSYGPTLAINSIPDGYITTVSSAQTGLTGMRIILAEGDEPQSPCGLYDYGETEDYTVNIVIIPPCTVPPVAGEATSSIDSMCTPTEITLNLVGNSTGAGQTYQWEFSTNNVDWDPLPGAIGTTATTTPTVTTWYRAEVTCSGNTVASESVKVTLIAEPVGNTQANPIVITSLPYSTMGNNLPSNCWTSDYTSDFPQASPDVFYTLTLNSIGTLNISTCDSTVLNTYIHLLDESGVEISSNDNNGPLCSGNYASDTAYISIAPSTYFVVVEGHDVLTGDYNLDITFEPDTAVGINPLTGGLVSCSLSPNPTSGDFTIHFEVKQQLNDDAIVKLYNALGQQLKEEKFSMTQGQFSGNMQIPQEAADGLYFLEVSAGGSRWNQQIVLQR